MRNNIPAIVLGLGGMLLFPRPMVAHHAFSAEFDANQPVAIRGTVTSVEWINPHSWIHLDVKRPDGMVENWMIEMGSPGPLMRMGFTKNSMPPGTELVVNGFKARDGSLKANGRDITLPDGSKFFVGSSGTGAPK